MTGVIIYAITGSVAVSDFGYQGVLGRTGAISKGIVGLMNVSTVFTGMIPRSVMVKGKGLTDDLIVFSRYRAHGQVKCNGVVSTHMSVVSCYPVKNLSSQLAHSKLT